MKLIPFLARQKFRFDLGTGFLFIINLTVIIIAAGDKIATLVHYPARTIVVVLVPATILAVWMFGYFIDKAGFWNAYQNETNLRNKMLTDALRKKEE